MSVKQTDNQSFIARYKSLPRNVFALSLVSLLNDTSSEIIYPILPVFLTIALGTSPFAIGLIEGLAESIASLLKLFSGYWSDKIRRRKPMVFWGYALTAFTRPFLAFTTTWPQVLAVRAIDRIGKGIRSAPRDALIATKILPEQRGIAFGMNRAADNLGAVIGPLISYILIVTIASSPDKLSVDDYRKIFLLASIPTFVALLFIVFFVKEQRSAEVNKKIHVKLSLREFDPNFKRFLVSISLFTLSNSTDAFLLLKAQELGVKSSMLPILWMLLHIAKVISSLIGGDFSDKIGRKKIILSGWILYSLVYSGFAFANSEWQIWLLFFIYGFYFGFTEGTERAFVADLIPEEKRGTAFGLYALAFSITVFPASVIFGAIWNFAGPTSAFLFGSTLSLLAAILFLTVKSPSSAYTPKS